MGFFNFGNTETVISFEEPKITHYSFMERGDLVYYTPPGSNKTIMATVEYFTRDDTGTPYEVTVTTATGEEINTTIKHITY